MIFRAEVLSTHVSNTILVTAMSEFESFVVSKLKKRLELESDEAERLKALLKKACLSREEQTELEKLITQIEFELFSELDKEFRFELIESEKAEAKLLRDVLMLEDSAVLEASITAVMFRFKVFLELRDSTLELIHFKLLDVMKINFDSQQSESDKQLSSLVLS